jgi:hypothetical protein
VTNAFETGSDSVGCLWNTGAEEAVLKAHRYGNPLSFKCIRHLLSEITKD